MDRVLIMGQPNGHETPVEWVEVESCHSVWSFDVRNHRFRRTLRGSEGAVNQPVTEWRPYFGLEEYPGSDSFVVWLNREGTRLLRSWRHRPDCPACAQRNTLETARHDPSSVLPPGRRQGGTN